MHARTTTNDGKAMNQSIIRINGDRLLDDLRTLRGFGACGTGVVRRSLSAVDMESRQWLVERMCDAGLDAGIDGMALSCRGDHYISAFGESRAKENNIQRLFVPDRLDQAYTID